MSLPLLELSEEAERAATAARQARSSRLALDGEWNAARHSLAASLARPEAAAICFALGFAAMPCTGAWRRSIWRLIPLLASMRSLLREID